MAVLGAGTIRAVIHAMSIAAQDVLLVELRPAVGGALPGYLAGAHVDLHLPGGLVRSYSLVDAPAAAPRRWRIAVQLEAAGRGGSREVHRRLRVGDVLDVAGPRNAFPLVEDGAPSVLVAGGIGITPVWCMAQRLAAMGATWRLHYAVRSRARAAFLEKIEALAGTRLHLHVDAEQGGRPLDIAAVVQAAPPEAHLYCCGPAPMLAAFRAAGAGRDPARLHTESFAPEAPAAREGGFEVALDRAGRTIAVAQGQTILDALLDAGVEVAFSCMEGMCGSCRVGVLGGVPEHRDTVLSAAERAGGKVMMVCCSGTRDGGRLVLDL